MHFWSLGGMMTVWFVFKHAPSKPVLSGSEATQANREVVQSQLGSFHWCFSFICSCLLNLNTKPELKSLCLTSHCITETQEKQNFISSSFALPARIGVKGRGGALRIPGVTLGNSQHISVPRGCKFCKPYCGKWWIARSWFRSHEQTVTALALAVSCPPSQNEPWHEENPKSDRWGKTKKPCKVRL